MITELTWYSYDPEYGFASHATADEAREHAEAVVSELRNNAADGWHPDVDQVEWGLQVPYGRAECVERIPAPEGSSFDEYEDWGLVEVERKPDNLTDSAREAGLVEALEAALHALSDSAPMTWAAGASLDQCAEWERRVLDIVDRGRAALAARPERAIKAQPAPDDGLVEALEQNIEHKCTYRFTTDLVDPVQASGDWGTLYRRCRDCEGNGCPSCHAGRQLARVVDGELAWEPKK